MSTSLTTRNPKFPHGKIPAFERSDGFRLFETVPIARYSVAGLAPNSGLLGGDLKESALIDQWIHLADTEVNLYTILSINQIRGLLSPYSKSIHDNFIERQLRALKTLNAHLATRTFFVGERITLADLYIAGFVHSAVSVTVGAATRAEIPHLIQHLETVVNQPKLKDIYGPVNYAEKALQYVPKEENEPK